jgi:hypothetical protein
MAASDSLKPDIRLAPLESEISPSTCFAFGRLKRRDGTSFANTNNPLLACAITDTIKFKNC